jgi:hypothetical protein
MKEAIEILKLIDGDEVSFNKDYGLSEDYVKGFKYAITALEHVRDGVRFAPYDYPRNSPDTEFKVNLTKWLELKEQLDNPYSIFEAWQKMREGEK